MKKIIEKRLFELDDIGIINEEFKAMKISNVGKEFLDFHIYKTVCKYSKIEMDKILETLERQSLRNNQLMSTFMNYIAIILTILTLLSGTFNLMYEKDETTTINCYDKNTKSEKDNTSISKCESSTNVHIAKLITQGLFVACGFFFLGYLVNFLIKEHKENKRIIYYTFIVKKALDRIE